MRREGGNRNWTAQVNDDGAKQRGQTVDSSVLQIHAATHAFNLYATMADAVDETYFQVGASFPTWKGEEGKYSDCVWKLCTCTDARERSG